MVRVLGEALVRGRADWFIKSGASNQRQKQTRSTVQYPPRRTQDQEQAAAEDEKVDGHGVLSVKEAFKQDPILNENKSHLS
jgi:hypothetical protein